MLIRVLFAINKVTDPPSCPIRKAELILAHGLRLFWGRHYDRSVRQMLTLYLPSGSRERLMPVLNSFSPFHSRSPAREMLLFTFSGAYLLQTYFQKQYHIQTQRYISMVLLSPIKLTVKINHCPHIIGRCYILYFSPESLHDHRSLSFDKEIPVFIPSSQHQFIGQRTFQDSYPLGDKTSV